jgi:hypothetical protein
LAFLVPASAFAQGAVYKWKDAQGNVHFSNVQPGEGATPDGATVAEPPREAPPSEPAPRVEPNAVVPAPAAGAAAATPGPYGDLSADALSTKVTAERLVLRRQLVAAKRELADAEKGLASETARKAKPTPAQVHDRIFIGVTGVESGPPPDRENEFRDRKERAEKKIAEIRARYGELESEATKRYGSLPGWFLPLD